jgi:hypothetical protein
MSWVEHLASMGWMRNAHRTLVRKPEGNKKIGTPRCRWVDNIKMDLREVELVAWTTFTWLGTGAS